MYLNLLNSFIIFISFNVVHCFKDYNVIVKRYIEEKISDNVELKEL